MKGARISRRAFLGQAGAVLAAPCVIPAKAPGREGKAAASERITVGFIGLGEHGIKRNLRMFLAQPDAQVAALCDVDRRRIEAARAEVRGKLGGGFECPTTTDWREVIARDDVDAVMVSTPDHWHTPISLAAVRAGKDVICEKPTLSIAEGRILADLVEERKAVFQTSTEDRSIDLYHRMAELVRNGRIGKLQRIRVTLPAGPEGPGDPAPKTPPEGLDWQMWLGPAPDAPYRDGLHPFHWRWVRTYSGGMLTDWGPHQLDTAQWANDTERSGPVQVEGTGCRHQGGLYDTYHEFHVKFRYDSGVELFVDSGGTGLRFEGSAGWVGNRSWRAPLEASSKEILESVIGEDEVRLFTCPAGEHRNFLDCVKSRRDPYFPAEVGHRCSTLAHLANIAIDLGRKLRWDPGRERFIDDDEANARLSRPPRAPWTL
jgi:predicted dehydrogenase